ncbi:MAG: 50S ribosomal protein L6, partial [Acidimicrobiales bacterium]
MSRIGRNPITVPAGVTVEVATDAITVTGPNGTMTRVLPAGVAVEREGDTLLITRASDETAHKALHGLTRTLVANMVTGVTDGWRKEL